MMGVVPQTPEQKGGPELLTVTEIAERYEVSRQTIHTLRRRGVFPEPVSTPGSTRLKFDAAQVDAYFTTAKPKQPGKKIEKRLQESEVKTDEQQQSEKPTEG